MDQLISEIEVYAALAGRTPQWVLRESIKAGWGVWERWRSAESSPTMATADRIRAWMAANPPAAPAEGEDSPAGVEAAE